jgi:hypothetical protein
MRLTPFEVWFRPAPGPLLPQLRRVLADLERQTERTAAGAQSRTLQPSAPDAEPLRWAITTADPVRGLRLEGVMVSGAAR